MAFVTIKYGNNQEALFNPNCKTMVLLDNIKKRCQCSNEAIVDLSDQKGEIKHLQERRMEYASSYLKEREILILLEVEKNENQEQKYMPLLKNVNKLYPEIEGQLENEKALDSRLDVSNHHSRPSTKSMKHRPTNQNGGKGTTPQPKHKKQTHDTHGNKKGHGKTQH